MIIYLATNIVNDKVYVGLTSLPLGKRKTQHFSDAKYHSYNSAFHKAIRKYGKENFKWEVIDKSETMEELNEKELYWISFYNSYKYGYNLTLGGGGALGYKYTAEDKEKVSKANRGEKSSSAIITEEVAKNIVSLLINTQLSYSEISDKTKANMSIIKQINHGQSWKHLYEEKPVSQNPFKRVIQIPKIEGDRIEKLKELLDEGLTLRKIAEKLGVTHPTILQTMKRNGLIRRQVV